MLNLPRYREQAEYAAHAHEVACSGREAYGRYASVVEACLKAAGARIVFAGTASAPVIAPADEQWDDVLLVEYPSGQAFLTMLGTPEYRAIAHHRSAALCDSRLVPVTAGRASFQAKPG